jgi:hypothetical protein
MKVFSAFYLAFVVSLGVLIAPWLLVAVLAGAVLMVAIWGLGKLAVSKRSGTRTWVVRVRMVLILACIVGFAWAMFPSKARAPQALFGVSGLNSLVVNSTGAQLREAPPREPSAIAWGVFESAVQKQRQKLTLIEASMDLYRAADRHVSQGRSGDDITQIDRERSALRETLESGGSRETAAESLFSDEALMRRGAAARAGLEELITQGRQLRSDWKALRGLASNIQTVQQRQFRVESLYEAARRMRSALGKQLEPTQTFELTYSGTGASDRLEANYVVRIDLNGVQAQEIDVEGMFDKPPEGGNAPQVTVHVQQDGQAPTRIESNSHVVPIDIGTQTLSIYKKVTLAGVSSRPIKGWLLTPVREVPLMWPMRSEHSVILRVRSSDGGDAWPYDLSLSPAPGRPIDRIVIPRYSFFHATPGMTVKPETDGDQLTFEGTRVSLKDLSAGVGARLQVVPRFLRFEKFQSFKEWLFFENFFVGALIAGFAALPIRRLLR